MGDRGMRKADEYERKALGVAAFHRMAPADQQAMIGYCRAADRCVERFYASLAAGGKDLDRTLGWMHAEEMVLDAMKKRFRPVLLAIEAEARMGGR